MPEPLDSRWSFDTAAVQAGMMRPVDCIDWLLRIAADVRSTGRDAQVLLDEDGVGPAMPLGDEMELLAISLRNTLDAIDGHA